jgi:hypothetical protein
MAEERYANFQTIINFRVNLDTMKTEMTSGWTRPVNGTTKKTTDRKIYKKDSTLKVEDVEVAEW